MLLNNENNQLMYENMKARERIQAAKNLQPMDLLTEMKQNWEKFDKGRHLYEEYDVISYESKTRVDMMYYDQLLEKLEEGSVVPVQQAITELYKDINKIYHQVNLKPAVYGGLDSNILNESLEASKQKLSKIIYEFIDDNFYRLSPDQRSKKYREVSIYDAKKLIAEGTSPDEAISFSIKTIVMENLLRHVAFPFSVWSRISHLKEDKDYGDVFDVDRLNVLLESFQRKLHNVARIVTTCI